MGQKPKDQAFNHEGRKVTKKFKDIKTTKTAYKILLCALSILVVGSLFLTPPAARAQPAQVLSAAGGYVPDEVLVKVGGSVSSALRKSLGKVGKVADSGVTVNDGNLLVVKVPEGTVAKAIQALQKQPGVIYAEPNYYAYAQDVIPNDPAWPNQYGPVHINAPEAWAISKGVAGVTIAILDSGVDFHQPDLAPKLVAGFDFVNQTDDPQDDFGHGTMVASIAAAQTNNHIGIAGISWGARIMPVKVLGVYGTGTFLNVAAGIRFAADHGARVINLSLGGPVGNNTLQDAVDYAAGLGVVLVAAAGNNSSNVLFPAAYPNVIAVGATDDHDLVPKFSNKGPEVALVAPGVNIIADALLANGRSLDTGTGTSFSAPFVSGSAAILLGIPGNVHSSDVIRQLETTARDLGDGGRDPAFGFGLLQLDAALKLAVAEHPLTPTSTPQKKKTERQSVNGPTATPEFFGGFGGGVASLTPTPTLTATATSTSTATSTPTLTATSTATPTSGAALAAKPTDPPAAVMPMPPMPWVAGFFLLAGMGLIGYALVLRRNT